MNFTVTQERVFEIFDDLIDEGIDVVKEIATNNVLRTRVCRYFSPINGLTKTKSALYLYGMVSLYTPKHIPSKEDLVNCFTIDNEYKVVFDIEFAQHIANVTGNSLPDIRKLTHGVIKNQWELEALDMFVRGHDDDYLCLYQNIRDHGHIRTYYRTHFGKIKNFRKAFGIDFRLHPAHTRVGVAAAIQDGFRFEKLVKRCFDASGTSVMTDFRTANCRPDFVAEGNHWIDAKLSKSTSFSGSETIEKYTKHADYLTLVYAIDDIPDELVPDLDDIVTLIHVFDYFEDLPEDLEAEIERFIDDILTRRKAGVA